jgi:hypothetical protein
MKEDLGDFRRELADLRRSVREQRILVAGIVAIIAFPLLFGFGRQAPGPQKASSYEVVDGKGTVRARIEPGKIALYSSSGVEKARIICDETNGNLVLSGEKQKRLEVFMDASTPRVVLYGPDGGPTMVLPPPGAGSK